MGDTVLYEAADGVATLTLNRPERLNAITPELVEDFGGALAPALDDGDVRVVRLRGAGPAFCAGYDIGWGSAWMQEAEGGAPWDPIADYATMRRAFGARRPRRCGCIASASSVPSGCCSRGRRDRHPPRGGVGAGLRGGAAGELEAAGLALARRVALLPHNQAAMMKLLVNQAFEQMGLHTTQLIGTLRPTAFGRVCPDGAARHTPEGMAFTRRGLADVGGAVADRDAPFGDYGQGPATV